MKAIKSIVGSMKKCRLWHQCKSGNCCNRVIWKRIFIQRQDDRSLQDRLTWGVSKWPEFPWWTLWLGKFGMFNIGLSDVRGTA